MRITISVLFFLTTFSFFSQKKVIDHQAYNTWKRLSQQQISSDGNYVCYEINPYKGNGYLYFYNVQKQLLDSVQRGYNASFSDNNNLFIYQIKPDFDSLRNCELNKVKKDNWPTDTLVIRFLDSDSIIRIPNVSKYEIAKTSDWIHYQLTKNELKIDKEISKDTTENVTDSIKVSQTKMEKLLVKLHLKKKKIETTEKPKKEKKKEPETNGKLYYAINPITSKEVVYKSITSFTLSENGKYTALISHEKNDKKQDVYQLKVVELNTNDIQFESKEKTQIGKVNFNHSENQLVYISSSDTTKLKDFELNLINLKTGKVQKLIDTTSSFLPKGKGISQFYQPQFTKKDNILFFGTNDRENKYEKDTLLEKEKVNLDIWNYKDSRLQSQQLVELKDDEKKSIVWSYDLTTEKFTKLSNDSIDIRIRKDLTSNYIFGKNIQPYEASYQWDSPFREDHYRINILTGKIDLLHKGTGFGGNLSPSGKYYTYFDGKKQEHKLVDIEQKKEICITCQRKDITWVKDNNGTPQLAEPFPLIEWSIGEDRLFIESDYDIWVYELNQIKLTSLSNEKGLKNKEKIRLYNFQSDSLYLDLKETILVGVNDTTGNTTIYGLNEGQLDSLYYTEHELISFDKAKKSTNVIYRKSSLADYPEVYLSSTNFKNEKQLSVTNPQQNEYNWATVEKVNWISYNGEELVGLLYKPENFDENKEYPMLVYYYELSSDRIHNYYSPKPTASIIYPTEYASAGYVVFMPDIRYVEGHPAQSAYDCIMSGVDKVLKLYPNIDSKRMGLQGQSWGGYQTAQLITMTDRFAAAMAGAPVSNMFSAYGGIRWGSGLNRQFQYEKQQSRIGKTIWEAPELYVENSPLFHLPNVKTPLLIMANDNDGAVPWYQGIELFTGMKRLGKPCWMLNYNGDEHNLMKEANRMDLSIRMRQFFDYYLQGKPAPKWLIEGIPAVDKGKEFGFELVK